MKTDNFKMDFLTFEGFKFTEYQFGKSLVRVYLEIAPGTPEEYFSISYYNNGNLKLYFSSFDCPSFLNGYLKMLYYGFLDYTFVNRKNEELARQVIGCIRVIQNYCKRKGIKMV